jgi:hypothetical protein
LCRGPLDDEAGLSFGDHDAFLLTAHDGR